MIFSILKILYILLVVSDKLRKIVAKCAFFAYFGTFSILKNAKKKNIDVLIFFSRKDSAS